jgi:UDPglucose--hexose-1-phosphate uridylyltransferase
LRSDAALEKHADWAEGFVRKYQDRGIVIGQDNVDAILKAEIGDVFMRVLLDAGVYKRTEEGQKAFDRFIKTL